MKTDAYLASFCMASSDDLAGDLATLEWLAGACEARFQYFEVVYVAGESTRHALTSADVRRPQWRNLRVLMVGDEVSYHTRRLVAATEAIGDVVTVVAAGEPLAIDTISMAARAHEISQVIIACGARRWFSPAHWLLGVISRHHVQDRGYEAIALPRARLNQILLRPSAAIDLRFQPKRGLFPYVRQAFDDVQGVHRSSLAQRVALAAEIVTNAAPRFLKAYAGVSLVVLLLSLIYQAYAIAVLLTKPTIQEGWFSTTTALNGAIAFISMGFAVTSLGIARLVERLETTPRGHVMEELGNASFHTPAGALNVDIALENGVARGS